MVQILSRKVMLWIGLVGSLALAIVLAPSPARAIDGTTLLTIPYGNYATLSCADAEAHISINGNTGPSDQPGGQDRVWVNLCPVG